MATGNNRAPAAVRRVPTMKLRRVSDRLYEEDSEHTTKPLRWTKGLGYLTLDLYELRAVEGLSVDALKDEDGGENIRGVVAKGRLEKRRELCLMDPKDGERSTPRASIGRVVRGRYFRLFRERLFGC